MKDWEICLYNLDSVLNPRFSFWYGVDPKTHQMPAYSPYVYCLNNPIKLIDPDGKKPTDWYLNKTTGAYEWHDGSAKIGGLEHLGKQTSGGNHLASFNLKSDGSFTLNGKSYRKGESASVESGNVSIQSNLSMKETGFKMVSDALAPFVELPQDILFPIINQVNIAIKEGIHEGRAYNSENVVLPNTYELNNWNLKSGRSNQSLGNPTREEGQEIIENTLSVFPSPLSIPVEGSPIVKKIVDKAANSALKTSIKKLTRPKE